MKYAILFVLFAAVACAAPADTAPTESTQTPPEPPAAPSQESAEPDVTFSLTGENFAFFEGSEQNPDLVVNEGDLVRIEFSSTGGMHDWVVDQFDARTDIVMPIDGMTAVEFVADETGTFEYYCSVGSHRAAGMVGNLIVE